MSRDDLCVCGHYRRRHVLDAQNCQRCDPEVPCPSFVLVSGPSQCLGGVCHESTEALLQPEETGPPSSPASEADKLKPSAGPRSSEEAR